MPLDLTSSPLDALGRLAYRGAYVLARFWWFLRRPRTASALVALWHGEELLMVRASYRPHYSLPGGFMQDGESALAGALRELGEEVMVSLGPERLTAAWHGTLPFENRLDTITIFETIVETRPAPRVDRREIVWADWLDATEARRRLLLPHVRQYLDARDRIGPTSPSAAPAEARSP